MVKGGKSHTPSSSGVGGLNDACAHFEGEAMDILRVCARVIVSVHLGVWEFGFVGGVGWL